MQKGSKTRLCLHLHYYAADQCDSKPDTGKSELKIPASEWDHNTLKATFILSYSTAEVRSGVCDLQKHDLRQLLYSHCLPRILY